MGLAVVRGALALTVVEDKPWSGRLATLDEASGGAIRRAAEAGRFRGEKGKIQLVLGAGEGLPARIVLCGMGKESPSLLDLNRAGAQMLDRVMGVGAAVSGTAVAVRGWLRARRSRARRSLRCA